MGEEGGEGGRGKGGTSVRLNLRTSGWLQNQHTGTTSTNRIFTKGVVHCGQRREAGIDEGGGVG